MTFRIEVHAAYRSNVLRRRGRTLGAATPGCAAYNNALHVPALAHIDPHDDTRLPDGSRRVDALALLAVAMCFIAAARCSMAGKSPLYDLYLVEVDPLHRNGRGRYYGPGGGGYTDNLRRAGVYTLADAEAHVRLHEHLRVVSAMEAIADLDRRRQVRPGTVGSHLGRCW
jgi:hypothetical protein